MDENFMQSLQVSHQIFLILFLIFFVVHFFLERGLAILNVRYVKMQRDRLPEIVREFISPENYNRSIDYTLARSRFGHVEAVVGAVLTLLYLFSGLLPWLQQQSSVFPFGEMTQGVILILSFTLFNAVLHLPMEWYETFYLEARFGFNQTTLKTFWSDKAKTFLLMLTIGIPFLYALLALIMRSGPLWWFWAALFVIGFQLLMMLLYPLWIAPWFNRFTPLGEGDLKRSLEELAQRCAFATRGIFVMDGSKRSTHSNAYFTGMGRSRRIVLFDMLIQQLNIPELVAVLAHEIGHYKKKHVLKSLLITSTFTFLGFYILSWLMNWVPMYQAFGISGPSVPVGILIFGLTAETFVFWLKPIFNVLSRRFEYEADSYAVVQMKEIDFLKTALLKLFEKNLATLTPHPAYSTYHYSHPTLIERITALQNHHIL